MKRSMLILAAATAVVGWAVGAAPAPSATPSATTQPAATAPGMANEVQSAITKLMTPVQVASSDDALQQKLKERHNTAVRILELRMNGYRSGTSDISSVFEAARVVADSKLGLAQSDDERQTVLEEILTATKDVESRFEKQFQAGTGSEASFLRARLARQTTEIELMKLKRPTTRPQ